MEKINFEKYPNIYHYIQHLIDKPHFKPSEYCTISESVYIEIFNRFISEYEKHRSMLIKNTLLLYKLTGEETGYSALSADWERRAMFHKEQRITEEIVTKWWDDKVIACIAQIYQSLKDGKHIYGGATGCLITAHYDINFLDHDKKGYKYNLVTDFSFSLNIGHSFHTEFDVPYN